MSDEESMSKETIAVPVAWVSPESVPIQFANQFAVLIDEGEIVLCIGQVTSPLLLGTPEEKMEQAEKISFVPVHTIARYALSRRRMGELSQVFQDMITAYDKQFGRAVQEDEGA